MIYEKVSKYSLSKINLESHSEDNALVTVLPAIIKYVLRRKLLSNLPISFLSFRTKKINNFSL